MKWAILLCSTLAIANPMWAQTWTVQTTPSTATVRCMAAVGDSNAWAGGANWAIWWTANGGTNWNSQASGTENWMLGLSFVSASTGWALGPGPTLLHTTTGGTSWTPQTITLPENPQCIYFLDSQNGWVGAQGGTLMHTTDGGSGWTTIPTGIFFNVNAVFFKDVNHGWLASAGRILRTVNGGANWTTFAPGTWGVVYAIMFTDTSNGWAVGANGLIVHSVDGGTNWTAQTSGVTNQLNGVAFTDPNNGWVIGQGGRILHTTNGGTAWAVQTSGTTSDLNALAFGSASSGWAGGTNGVILHYSAAPPAHAPSHFGLCSPAAGSVLNDSSVSLSWRSATDLDGTTPHYDVWVGTNPNLGAAVCYADSIADTTCVLPTLDDDDDYYWTVRATDNNTAGTWASDTFRFHLSYRDDHPAAFHLISPAQGAVITQYPVSMSWQMSHDPDYGDTVHYDVYLDTLAAMGTRWLIADSITDSSFSLTNGLLDDHTYYWVVRATDANTAGTWSDTLSFSVDMVDAAYNPGDMLPTEYSVVTNYPNPFNPSTTIHFGLPRTSAVTLEVFNVVGQRVAGWPMRRMDAGWHDVMWTCRDCTSGIYLLRLNADGVVHQRKLLLVK